MDRNETLELWNDMWREGNWVPYHLIHGAYHLGRVTRLRMMQGTKPKL